MIKRVLTALALIVLAALPAAAQGDGWTAWLFEGATGQMTEVSDSGERSFFFLPKPPGFDTFFRRVAVGHGGSPFAYIVYNSATFQGQLAVASRDGLLTSFNLPLTVADTFEFNPSEDLFNEDNSALAYGYSLDGGGWAVIVLETWQNGAVTNQLRSDETRVEALGIPAGFGLTPVVRQFAARMVTFTLVQSGTEAASRYDSYTWDLNTNTLTLNPAFPGLDADMLPATGETVMTLNDDRLPNQGASFMFFQANSLHVYDPFAAARFPFYNAPAETLFSPEFIQNGELILVNASPASGETSQWRVVRRDGSVVGTLPASILMNDVAGVPDGFIYTTDTFNPGSTTLVHVNTRDGLDAGVPVWSSQAGASPVIAWAGGTSSTAAQAVYTAWAALAEPVYLPAGLAPAFVPTAALVSPNQLAAATPVVEGFLAVGGMAIVNTTEGDQLNVRAAPGTGAAIVGKLSDGARVSLLDGPRFAEGYTWWKIRTASGIEGWAVESVNDNSGRLQTLLPG
ncbi:MAG: SH3 domain-containing protein [Chloroflexi bacterium]|nr:SH3 domain-containing protein [Chloroflexota bacterium]